MESEFLDATDLRLLELLQTDASRHNQALAALAHVSPPTSLRRIKRLRETGVIEREVALLHPDRLAPLIGHGLTTLVEVTLERQGAEHLDAFEAHVLPDPAVQQCYPVTGEADYLLVVTAATMADYEALVEQLFGNDDNVRRFRTSVALGCLKAGLQIPLPKVNASV